MKKEKTIRTYQRRTKSGKMVTVRQHTASYDAAEKAMEAAKKKGAGEELEAKKAKKLKETPIVEQPKNDELSSNDFKEWYHFNEWDTPKKSWPEAVRKADAHLRKTMGKKAYDEYCSKIDEGYSKRGHLKAYKDFSASSNSTSTKDSNSHAAKEPNFSKLKSAKTQLQVEKFWDKILSHENEGHAIMSKNLGKLKDLGYAHIEGAMYLNGTNAWVYKGKPGSGLPDITVKKFSDGVTIKTDKDNKQSINIDGIKTLDDFEKKYVAAITKVAKSATKSKSSLVKPKKEASGTRSAGEDWSKATVIKTDVGGYTLANTPNDSLWSSTNFRTKSQALDFVKKRRK